MEIDTNHLAKTYAELSDEKLLRMHASGELTETAYKVLEKELTRRGISLPEREATNEVPFEVPTSWRSKNFKLIIWLYIALIFLEDRFVGEILCPLWMSNRLTGQMGFLWAVGITCLILAIAVGAARQLYDYLYRSAGRILVGDEGGGTKEVLIGEVPPAFWYQYPYSKGIRTLSWFLVALLSAAFGMVVGLVLYPPQNGVLKSRVIYTVLFFSYLRFLISWGLIRILVFRMERNQPS